MTNYADFNSIVVNGRIADSKIATGANGDFLAVTLLSNATTDGQTVAYSFTNNNGLMSLYEAGHLGKGRELTITGHLASVEQVYTARDGSVRVLQQPRVKLSNVVLMDGGLGRKPAAEAASSETMAGKVVTIGSPTVDKAPVVA